MISYERIIRYTIFILVVFLLVYVGVKSKTWGRNQGFKPQQPIAFSHKTHCKDAKINCIYCHSDFSHARYAGMPSTQACLNCHEVIRRGSNSGLKEINKLNAAKKNRDAIAWVRVNDLPDYVYFNHAQHTTLAGLSCTECHGQIEEMDETFQAESLTMGWCLDCHRTSSVNKKLVYYQTYFSSAADSLEKLKVSETGGEDCMSCHF